MLPIPTHRSSGSFWLLGTLGSFGSSETFGSHVLKGLSRPKGSQQSKGLKVTFEWCVI